MAIKGEDEIPVLTPSEDRSEPAMQEDATDPTGGDGTDHSGEELHRMLELERERASNYEDKLRHALADFENLSKKTRADIENGVNQRIDRLFLSFLEIYDDLARAKDALDASTTEVGGLAGILKNMDSLLDEYRIKPMNSVGDLFDPNLHEAISVADDPHLDDGTITKEIRKGYILENRVIRPALVEISKRV